MDFKYLKIEASNYPDSKTYEASKYIKEKFDFEVKKSILDSNLGYDLLYKYIIEKTEMDDKLITIGGDHTSTIPTVLAQRKKFGSNLHLIIFDSAPDLHNMLTFNNSCKNRMTTSYLLGNEDIKGIMKQDTTLLTSDKIIYFGLREIEDTEMEILNGYGIMYFSIDRIRKMGIDTVLDVVKGIIGGCPVHISVDMKVFDPKIAPSVTTQISNGLTLEDIDSISNKLKDENIVSIDITELDAAVGSEKDKGLTGYTAKKFLGLVMGIKEKKLNVYDENTEFLVYRQMEQEDEEADIGWYILRNIDIETMNQILKSIPKSGIIQIEVDGEDCLVSRTNIEYQQERSYYTTTSVTDVVLFPQEKEHMIFELINKQTDKKE